MLGDMVTFFSFFYILLWILVILHSLLLLGVVRIVHQLQQEGFSASADVGRLSQGTEAPSFSTWDVSGAPISNANINGHLTALLFVSPKCASCTATLYEVEALEKKTKGHVIIISRSQQDEAVELAMRHNLRIPVVADTDDQLTRLFGISSVPTAVLIENNRIQRYGAPKRGDELKEMLDVPSQVEREEVA